MRTMENLIMKSAFVAFSVLLAACTTDLYVEPDPTPPAGGGTTATDGPSFSTITETNLTVNVDDEYNGAYMYGVEVYTENPLLVADAEPIYGGLTKGNVPLVLKMDVSQALEQVYVLQKDPTQGKSVIALAISEETTNLSCDFKAQKTTTKSGSLSALRSGEEKIVDLEDFEIQYSEDYTFKKEKATNWVIQKGTDLRKKKITVGADVTLRVEGFLECDQIIVAKGATLINDSKVIATERLTAQEGSFIENNCNIAAEEFISENGVQVKLGTSTIFKCTTINSTGTTYSLDNYAILRTTGKASFGKGENRINSTGDDRCLLDFGSMVEGAEVSGDKVVTLAMTGNVDLLCSTIEYPSFNWPSTVRSVNKLASVNIPAGDCTGEGNEVKRPNPDNVDMDVVPNGGMYTFAMEDNWPSFGDYDMNDLVLGIQTTLKMNANQEVTTMNFSVLLRAVGATRKLGAGIQLDNVSSSNISRAFAAEMNGSTYFTPGANGVEEGEKAVLPFFDDAHHMIGAQGYAITNTTKQTNAVKTITGEINFINPVPQSDLLISKLNFFIVNSGDATGRTEVHLAGYKPTAKVKGEASYWSTDGMMWGILVPGEFKYPKETVRITDAYPEFKNWSQSGRREDKDWYKNPVSGKVMEEKGI